MTEAPALLDVFCLRAWARAHLYGDGELDLQDAVDELQAAAEHYGLVGELGQDAVQELIAEALAEARKHVIEIETESIDESTWEIPKYSEEPRAAESTVDALAYSLRTRGTAALHDPDNQHHLAELSIAQIEALIVRLSRVRERYPAIDDEMLTLVAELLP